MFLNIKLNIDKNGCNFEKKYMRKINFLLIFYLLVFISCSSKDVKISPTTEMSEPETVDALYNKSINNEEKKSSVNEQTNNFINFAERKLIKEGSISFETKNVNHTKWLIEKNIKAMNGYISKEYSRDMYERLENTLEVRIPADKFDDFMKVLSSTIRRLDNKNIQVQDVTEEYIDVKARLNAKKEVLARYLELLKQAKNVTEMMDVENEIGNVQSEIESMEGRLKYLSDRISLSTITVTFYEHSEKGFSFWHKILNGLSNGWRGFLWIVIGFVYLWPLWLILLVVLWTLRYFLKHKKNHKKNHST